MVITVNDVLFVEEQVAEWMLEHPHANEEEVRYGLYILVCNPKALASMAQVAK